MNRKEQIDKASVDWWMNVVHQRGDAEEAFMAGANFADSHPAWVSVKDELPKDYEPVLAAFGHHFVRVCFHCGEKWYLDDSPVAEGMFGVTHWMPLPPPPTMSSDQDKSDQVESAEISPISGNQPNQRKSISGNDPRGYDKEGGER